MSGSGPRRWRARTAARKLDALPPIRRPLLVALFALFAAIYLADLANTPVYLGGDEAHFGVGAQTLADTGRSLRGDRWPLFINLADPMGGKPQAWGDTYYQPFLFYLIALFFKFVPLSITAVRVPTAIIGGIITPWLFYTVARRVLGQFWPAVIAVLVLALSPAHVILSRQALDYICPLPFVIGWLWCLHSFMAAPRRSVAIAAGAILGIGCYSYIASWLVMPLLLVVMWIVMLRAGHGWRPVIESAVAFAIPVSGAVIWIAAHPDMLRDTVARYGIAEAPKAGLLPTYWSLIDPTLWFVRGGPSATTSTARSGFVLAPVALLLLAGLAALWRRRDWMAAVLAAGVVIALIPAALKQEPGMIQRAMYVLPFAALIAGFGWMWLSASRLGRAAALAAVVLMPMQFAYFYVDYFGHYKLRSAFYYDPVAFTNVAEYLMREPATPALYFTNDVDDASVKWRFYTMTANRTELLARTQYIEPDHRPPAPPGSLLVTYDYTARLAALTADGWRKEAVISDVDNRPAAVILRR